MQKAGTRRRKANLVFFRVSLSYLKLFLVSKIRGRNYWDDNIKSVNIRSAERIRDVMLHLQGLFIKFGQLISTLSNVLPEEFRKPLEALQNEVPAHSFDLMADTIKKELGKNPEDIFSYIDHQPLASASIGQVHRATIGEQEVVVKIQHPQIDELVHVDLSIISKIISLVARFLKVKGIEHLYQQVEQMIEEELNYLLEAQSMQLIKKNLKDEKRVYIPEVYSDFCSEKVLTMEYCEGVKISDMQQIKNWGFTLDEFSELLVSLYCKMIFSDGFYHADPHPGNLLINQQGQLVFLDFGAVAQLSPDMKEGIPKLIECLIKQDSEEMVRVLRKLGFLAQGDDAAKIAEKLIDSVQDFVYNELQLENLNIQNISPEQLRMALKLINIREMTQIMQIPKDWVLLNRAVVLVGGVTFMLSPEWNPIEAIKPFIRNQLSTENTGFTNLFVSTLKKQLGLALTIPAELQKVLRKVNKGKLEVETKFLKQELRGIRAVGQQTMWLLFFFASVYFYLMLHNNASFPRLIVFFQCSAGFSFALFLWKLIWIPKG